MRWSILVFASGVLAVLGALGWVTFHALRLEHNEIEFRRQARYAENMRLALWRMDAAITPLIAREAARPFFEYQPYFPAERAYSQMFADARPGEVLVPSPLLENQEPWVHLYFQRDEQGGLTSPNAPSGAFKKLARIEMPATYSGAQAAERLTQLSTILFGGQIANAPTADAAQLEIASSETAVPPAPSVQWIEGPRQQQAFDLSDNDYALRQNLTTTANITQNRSKLAGRSADEERSREEGRKEWAQAAGAAPTQSSPPTGGAPVSEPLKDQAEPTGVTGGGAGLSESRSDLVKPGEADATRESAEKQDADPGSQPNSTERDATASRVLRDGEVVNTGPFVPRWVVPAGTGEAHLLYEREVSVGDQRLTQGFWIDWPALRGSLLDSTKDLFPQATLRPLLQGATESEPSRLARTLAAIPAEFDAPMPTDVALGAVTPIRSTLVLTWAVVIAAVVALALVLRTSMELAERRGQFVSAVTHELRTPLTTFVMYSQMLADGLVRDEESQRSYIGTLKGESQRLARIVESVLDYARLSKRQRPATVKARLTAEQIVDSLAPVLVARCKQSGMELVIERESLLDFPVTTDPPTLERIIYNLVDNACKYACNASDKRVHLVARLDRGHLLLVVKDHGPGIEVKERTHVFRPFSRGRSQQHGSTPGLGLGLALAQGLARELGGDLRLASAASGAEFHVRLPRD